MNTGKGTARVRSKVSDSAETFLILDGSGRSQYLNWIGPAASLYDPRSFTTDFFGSVGWGFESLRARQLLANLEDPHVAVAKRRTQST